MAYEDRDVINNPSIYAEMAKRARRAFRTCVEVNGHMLTDVSGDEVRSGAADRRLRRPTGLATRTHHHE
jgi:hypothetical protein